MGVMDDEQVGELRRWASGLATDPRPEVQAAAKAITLLADDVAAARSQLLEERLIREALEANEPSSRDGEGRDDVQRDLVARIRSHLPGRLAGSA
jgi:hypothetical protein